MEHQTDSIESKEIRGVNFKNLYALIVGIAIIVTSVVTCFYGLKDLITSNNAALVEKINNVGNTVNTEKAVNQIRLGTLERRVDAVETQVRINELNKPIPKE